MVDMFKAPQGQVKIVRHDLVTEDVYPVDSYLDVSEAQKIVLTHNNNRKNDQQDAYRLYNDQGLCLMHETSDNRSSVAA